MDIRRKYRLEKLLVALQGLEKLRINEAASLLNVSEMTIRRDISSGQNSLRLLGGYIVASASLNGMSNNRYFITEQQERNVVEKQKIGILAASLVQNNDTIFFDSGTTIPFIIHAIDDSIKFTALCYSIHAFLALKQKANCRVILCGGEFKESSQVFIPITQPNELTNIYSNKAFISAAGVCAAKGVTTWVLDEVSVKQLAIQNSEYTLLVSDNEKFEVVRPGLFANLEDFDELITNDTPPESINNFILHSNIKLTLPLTE
ncbi:DNA-binding transcriptional repressor DeoR [Thorsellia anophelis]|uniref:DNA-binding transcriptional repressor DeoR n=1 Tax=Thorsellia anophelis TaxID=336804 RepID=UPI0015A61FBD|nr:DNA-binding transcriptional repressor DeoR [Thorsellia anophelis]